MMKAPAWLFAGFFFTLAFCGSHAARGRQDDQGREPRINALRAKEEMIRDELSRLQGRMLRIREELKSLEPENAERVEMALVRLGQSGTLERVEDILSLLEKPGRLADAVPLQEQSVEDLQTVLDVLLRRDAQIEERREEMQQLGEEAQRVGELLDRQRALRDKTAEDARLKELTRSLADRLSEINALLEAQRALGEQTRSSQAAQADALAQSQAHLAEQAKALERRLSETAQQFQMRQAPALDKTQRESDETGAAPDAAGPQRERPSSKGENAETSKDEGEKRKAADRSADKADDSAAEPRDGEKPLKEPTQPAPSRPEAPSSADPSKPAPPNSTAPSESAAKGGSQNNAEQSAERAAKKAGEAADHMNAASEQLNDKGTSPEARTEQQKAEQALEKARQALEEVQRRVLELKDAGAELAEEQKKLAEDAGRDGKSGESPASLQRQGPEDSQPQPSGENQQGSQDDSGEQSSDQGLQPRQEESLRDAQQHMWDAMEDLKKLDSSEALKDQDQAIEQLERAQGKIEDALVQKRREERVEVLRDLEARFQDLYVRQAKLNEDTAALADQLSKPPSREQTLQSVKLGQQQEDLAQRAATSLHVLEEEGTTVVFPAVLGQVREDMSMVTDRLNETDLGAMTLAMQSDILESLDQVIATVQKMRDKAQQQQQNAPPSMEGDEQAPLLPLSAEMRLLREAQLRVRERTQALRDAEKNATGAAADLFTRALEATAERQARCAAMAEEMRKRIEQRP